MSQGWSTYLPALGMYLGSFSLPPQERALASRLLIPCPPRMPCPVLSSASILPYRLLLYVPPAGPASQPARACLSHSRTLALSHACARAHTHTHLSLLLSNSFLPWSVRPYMTIFFYFLIFKLPTLPFEIPGPALYIVLPAASPRYAHTLPLLCPPHVPFKRCTKPCL